jgi:hypothetical protein
MAKYRSENDKAEIAKTAAAEAAKARNEEADEININRN